MNTRSKLHPHHKLSVHNGGVVVPGSSKDHPDIKIEPAVTGLCAVITQIKAQKTGNQTIGPFEIVDLYYGDGHGNAQWIARRERNLIDENDTCVVYFISLGEQTYFVLVGVVMKIADPKFLIVPTDTKTAYQVRGVKHDFEQEWKGAVQVKIVG